MLILGYIGALFIGIIMGLLGGGGSILAVPILVYGLKIDPVIATAYSLFIVGISALFGTIRNVTNGMIHYRIGILFAIPTLLTVFITRMYILPAIPNELFTIQSVIVTKNIVIMILFAVVMILASYSMIKGTKEQVGKKKESKDLVWIIVLAIPIGFIAGLVGAGGGFLIIPALVLIAKLPMKKAVATSLLIIAIQSLIGFTGSVKQETIDWPFLAVFSSISVLGIFIGIYLSRFIEGEKLKKTFGWFVLTMGTYILIKEIIFSE